MSKSSLTIKDVHELYNNLHQEVPGEFRIGHGEDEIRNHKYGARKKELDGHVFDSTGECQAYLLLRLWEAAGVISELEVQPVFMLQEAFDEKRRPFQDSHGIGAVPKPLHHRAVTYRADFLFWRNGRRVVVDFKGMKTATYRVKIKLFRAKFPNIEFEEWDRKTLKDMSAAI